MLGDPLTHTEFAARVYDAKHPSAYHWQVNPGPDGFGVEIVYHEPGRDDTSIVMPMAVAAAMGAAITRIVELNPGE